MTSRRAPPWLWLLLLCACAGNARQVVERRAEFDLECPARALELVELSACSYGVRGCGKKAAYLIKPGSPEDQRCVCLGPCDAVLNVDVTPTGAAPGDGPQGQ